MAAGGDGPRSLSANSSTSQTLSPTLKILLSLGKLLKYSSMKKHGLAVFLDDLHVGPVLCR